MTERVEFYFDPMCPYAYQTSVWIRDVREQVGLDITWRFFSLEEVNRVEGKKHPWERPWSFGWGQMRVGSLLRREQGNEELDRWYAAVGSAGLRGRWRDGDDTLECTAAPGHLRAAAITRRRPHRGRRNDDRGIGRDERDLLGRSRHRHQRAARAIDLGRLESRTAARLDRELVDRRPLGVALGGRDHDDLLVRDGAPAGNPVVALQLDPAHAPR